jgi:Na+/H+ antiporter NhaA
MASRPDPRFAGRTAWTRSLRTPLRAFLQTESGGAAVLLGAAVAALVWVNVHAGSYDDFWATTLAIEVGGSGVSLSLNEWVNSGLMAFFFFVLGLEARRELDLGELRDRRRLSSAARGCFGVVDGAETAVDVVVDHADVLHERVHARRSDKAVPLRFQLLRERLSLRGRRGEVCD